MRSQAWRPFERPSFEGAIESITYDYDVLGNLTTQERAWWRYELGGAHNNVLIPTDGNYWGRSKERYGYDPLQRLLSVDRQVCNGSVAGCAYVAPVPERHPYVEYAYDAVGNITRKTDFADVYAYGTAASSSQVGGAQQACGPNALLNVVTSGSNIHRTYQCDNNGNQVAELMSGSISGTRRVLFNGANLPARIDHTDPYNPISLGGHVDFAYGPDNARYRRTERGGQQVVIHYGAEGYEQEVSSNQTVHRIELGPVVYTRRVTQTANGPIAAPSEVGYQLRDRLGSSIAIADRWGHFNGTDESVPFYTPEGLTRRFYDPFGAPTYSDFGTVRNRQQKELGLEPTSWRGFTGHEHLDGARLIHMNGRLFDYRSGRFLSVDPIIQAPGNSQSLNPYSYVFNNPLSGTDPTGYQSCSKTSTKESDVGTECTAMARDPRSANKLGTMITVRVGADSNGADGMTSGGASSAPSGGNATPADIGSSGGTPREKISRFLMPYATEMQKRGMPGSWGDRGMGALKALGNNGASMLQMLNPAGFGAMMLGYQIPEIELSDQELEGAADLEVATLVAGPIMRGISMMRSFATASSVFKGMCFEAGTPVHTLQGPVPIESIQIGDLVAAKDEATGEVTWKPVVQLFRNTDQPIIRVAILLDSGEAEDIGATLEHPFWVDGWGWTPASGLMIGDKLVLLRGGTAVVVSAVYQAEREDTYNFEVAEAHTYFVGMSGIWVHNQSLFRATKGEAAYFRGAKPGDAPSFVPRPNEFKVDPNTGFVKDTHGVSVFDNPSSVSSKGFVPHRVDQSSIPDSLRIIQRGNDLRHFEIVPVPGANLTPQQFINACSSIVCVK